MCPKYLLKRAMQILEPAVKSSFCLLACQIYGLGKNPCENPLSHILLEFQLRFVCAEHIHHTRIKFLAGAGFKVKGN